MKGRAQSERGGVSAAGLAITLGVVCLLVLVGAQVLNHRKVHGPVCKVPGLVCAPAALPTAFDVQGIPAAVPSTLLAHPLHVRADTALLRRGCDGHWVLGFGARFNADPLSLGPQFSSGAACAEVFLRSAHAVVAGAQLRYGDCAATLDPVVVDWNDALVAKLTARVAPEAWAGCAALLPASLGAAVDRQGTAPRVDLDLRHAIPFARFAAGDGSSGGVSTPITGWVRKGLSTMETVHELRVGLPHGSLSVRLATTPATPAAPGSPELVLSLGARGSVLDLLTSDLKRLAGASVPLTVRWRLDQEGGVVVVNDHRIERQPAAPRAPGLTVLGAAECSEQAPPSGGGPAPSLYFVEAGDAGEPSNPAQVQALFKAVEEATAGPGVLVSVFVHGWQHSAAPGDSYVCDYGRLIGAIDTMEAQAARASGRTPRQVLGVYVGWPGRLYADEIANGTTFWNRLAVADRLGAKGALLRQVIDGLAERVARRAPEARADRRSALIVTGHSLGGRAVFHAVRDELVASADGRAGTARPDLVLLVNPAFSAGLYRDIDAKERQCQPLGMRLLSFSSEADKVTRQVYPAGQAMTFNPAAQAAAPFPEHVYTAANFGEFVTHRLRLEPLRGDPPGPTDAQTIVRGFARVPAGSRELYADNPVTVFRQPVAGFPRPQDAWYRMRLEPVATAPAPCPDTTARVIEVDARVLPDHGTLFTPSFMEYVVRLLNRSVMGGTSNR